jgi:hypothetical protein
MVTPTLLNVTIYPPQRPVYLVDDLTNVKISWFKQFKMNCLGCPISFD